MRSFIVVVGALLPLFGSTSASELFTVNCRRLTVQRSDPIVSPGAVSSHVHVVIGGTNFSKTETNQDAIKSQATTCDKLLDNSNYWIPQLYHENKNGTFSLVTTDGSAVYYINRVCDYKAGRTKCDSGVYPRAPPAGLRMLAGNPTLRTYNGSDFRQSALDHVCLNSNNETHTHELPKTMCNRMRSQIFFPSCWDGKNLDSDNHSSHMSYPTQGSPLDYNVGVCPSTHPVAIYSIFYEFFFETSRIIPAADFNRWVYAMGDSTGYGLHGDFINGWTDQDRLERAMATCTGSQGINDPNCSLRVNGQIGQASSRKTDQPEPTEDVGQNGPIAKLPGNNPVTKREALEWFA